MLRTHTTARTFSKKILAGVALAFCLAVTPAVSAQDRAKGPSGAKASGFKQSYSAPKAKVQHAAPKQNYLAPKYKVQNPAGKSSSPQPKYHPQPKYELLPKYKLLPGKTLPGKVQAGTVQPGKVLPGKVQPGKVQPGKVQPGKVNGIGSGTNHHPKFHPQGPAHNVGFIHKGNTYQHWCFSPHWNGWTRHCWYPRLGCLIFWSPNQHCWYIFIRSEQVYVPCDDLTDEDMQGNDPEQSGGTEPDQGGATEPEQGGP